MNVSEIAPLIFPTILSPSPKSVFQKKFPERENSLRSSAAIQAIEIYSVGICTAWTYLSLSSPLSVCWSVWANIQLATWS